jgi:hypothetical protein
MCAYYNIERFDTDYLSDAVAFFGDESKNHTRGHSVHVTNPGDRRMTATSKQ